MDNSTNCTNFGDGEEYWRARGKPFEWFDGIICLLVIIGIIGNSLVIIIHRRLRGDRATPTNRLIICLATADILTGVFILPIPEYENLPRNFAGDFYCHVVESRYLLWVSFRASVYALTAIALERFLAIVHPYTYKTWARNNYVKYIIAAIWVFPLVLRSPQLILNVVGECGRCDITFRSQRFYSAYSIVLFVIEFICPLITMIYTSIRIVAVLRRDRFNHDDGASRPSTQLQSIRRRFTIMCIFMCASFMILWTPDQLGIFLYRLGAFSRLSVYFNVFVTISFANGATTNPIIYSACLPPFRRALKDTVMCRSVNTSRIEMVDITCTDITASSVKSVC